MTTNCTADVRQTSHRRFGWPETLLLVFVATLIALVIPDLVRTYTEWLRLGPQTRETAELRNAQGNRCQVQYLVYRPEDFSAERPAPLLLYLHGSGQRGDDVNQLLKWGLPQQIGWGLRVPMMVVSPQCRAGTVWDSRELLALLDHLQERFAIDPDRIYVTGESMGGSGTWALCAAAPERFAAAAPICGGGNIQTAPAISRLPIWAFHGAEDQFVPVERSRRMVDVVQASGGHARLTVYAGEGHGVSELVFARQDLYSWLLDQRRPH